MDGGIIFFLAIVVGSVYILSRLLEMAEKSRMNSHREEAIREAIRKENQRRVIDELYGRDDK